MKNRDEFRLTAILLSLMLLIPGCASDERPTRPPDLLLAGIDPNYPPFEVLDSASGTVSGFDIELLSMITRANRWRCEDTTLPYEDLLPALRRGDIDIVASALSIPSDSQADLAFSDPYYLVNRVLVLRAADSLISCLEDLPSGVLGVIAGTDVSGFERRVGSTKAFPRKDISKGLAELAGGSLAAMVVDYTLARALLGARTDLRICSASLGHEYYVFAMRSADSLRLRDLNDALAGLLGGYSYEQLHQEWFGYPPLNVAVPDSVSARWPAR